MHELFKKLVNYKSTNRSCENNSYSIKNDEIFFNEDLKKDLKFNYGKTDFNAFHFSEILSYEQDFILDNISLNKGNRKKYIFKRKYIFIIYIFSY